MRQIGKTTSRVSLYGEEHQLAAVSIFTNLFFTCKGLSSVTVLIYTYTGINVEMVTFLGTQTDFHTQAPPPDAS